MRLHIVVPTIMTYPNQEFNCLAELTSCFDSHKLDYTIYFVANVSLPEFEEYTPINTNIRKSVSGLNFSISRALNSVFENIQYNDDDILGFIGSDTFFRNKNWIIDYIDLLNDTAMNAGVIGARGHTLSKIPFISDTMSFYNDKFMLRRVAWSDGAMLFKGKIFKQANGFDENYFGDRESQDFCYTVHHLGYNNYLCSDLNSYFGYENRAVPFSAKARYNKDEFATKVKDSTQYFYRKWDKFIKELH